MNFELSFVSKSSSQWNCKLYIGIEFMFVHFSISFFFFRLATTTTTTTTATANKRIWLFGKLNTLKSKLFILKKYKKKGLNFKKDSDFFNPNEKIENLLWLKSDATLRSNQYLELFLIDNNWIYILVNFSFRL